VVWSQRPSRRQSALKPIPQISPRARVGPDRVLNATGTASSSLPLRDVASDTVGALGLVMRTSGRRSHRLEHNAEGIRDRLHRRSRMPAICSTPIHTNRRPPAIHAQQLVDESFVRYPKSRSLSSTPRP